MEKSRRKLNCCLEFSFHIFDFQGRTLASSQIRELEKKHSKDDLNKMFIFLDTQSDLYKF